MKKWQKKINRRVNYYDSGWCAPTMCNRAYRRQGFSDGAEWMLKEVLHLLRQKKYKCDKMIRDGVTTTEKSMPTFAAALYSRIIKDLTE